MPSAETKPAVRWAILALVLATLAAYANTFRAPFVFDDQPTIVDNASLRHLWPLGAVLAPSQAGGLTTSGRPLVNLSLALNYALTGENVWSYHAVNLLIHLAAGLALFGLVRRTPGGSTPLAFAIAAVWTLHPLQTESVTYIVQRAESLAGLCYLLTLYCFVRGVEAAPNANPLSRGVPEGRGVSARIWFPASVIACLCGMASKETVVSAPLLVWLYDRTFLAGSFRSAWSQRRGVYVALAATWLLLLVLVVGTGGRGGTAGFGTAISAWSYALTQCRAIVHYLALSLWPGALVFDYGLDTERSLVDVLPQALLLVALLAATLWALRRRPVPGFLGAWFFALLAPSSSFVPVMTQTMAEHRMYLPLAAVAALVVGLTFAWLGARAWIGWAVAALALGGATFARNTDYRSEVAIWRDTAAKRPRNPRAFNNLGQALFREGKVAEAMRCYEETLRLQPKYAEAHYNLGVALADQNRVAEAIAEYEAALQAQPAYPEAHNNLGNALARSGRPEASLPHYAAALAMKPDMPEVVGNQGNSLLQMGRAAEAIPYFERALKIRPNHADSHYNLGNAYAAVDRMADALAAYQRALALKPDYTDAKVNAGNALLALGRSKEAVAYYEQALAQDPKLAVAHLNAGYALLDLEQWADAVPHLESALRLSPDVTNARRALGHAYAQVGRTADAIAQFEQYLRATPGDAEARRELGRLRAAAR